MKLTGLVVLYLHISMVVSTKFEIFMPISLPMWLIYQNLA